MKQMKKTLFTTVILMAFILNVKGQEEKDLAVSVGTGLLNSPAYEKASAQRFFRIDFDYYLTSRHILNASYLSGKHYYYDDVLSNDPTVRVYKNGTNATADYRAFSVLYKYKLLDNGHFNITPGAGLGVLTHLLEYPYKDVTGGYPRTNSWSDLVFPVNLEISYRVSNQWQFGLTGGFLIHPDSPILALHGGPRLLFVLP